MGIVPTGGPLGAEVRGVDLARESSSGVYARIADALREHLVLIFRSQELTRNHLVKIADRLGGCHRPKADEPALGDASLDPTVVVSNVHERGVTGSGELWCHADHEYLRYPCSAGLLYAVEVPSDGGETSWSNLFQAYDELSGWMQFRVRRLQRWADNPYVATTNVGPDYSAGPNQRISDKQLAEVLHPLIRLQPTTNRRALYVSRITTGIRGFHGPYAGRRARRLLRRLKRHVDQSHLYYTHSWRPGDVVVWDNLFTNHKRAAFDGTQRRVLYRVQVVGDQARKD